MLGSPHISQYKTYRVSQKNWIRKQTLIPVYLGDTLYIT